MYEVPNSAVVRWGSANDRHVPTVIDLVCPACKHAVSFHLPTWSKEQSVGMPIGARCPRCGRASDLLRLGGKNQREVRLYVDAENPAQRVPVAGLDLVNDEAIPPSLKRAYQSALNVFAIGEAEATAASCRRVLEGIMARVGTAQDGGRRPVLAQSIRALANQPEKLAQPIIELSDVLRERGNLAAHFSAEVETSVEDARRMLDLLDYLITYLFVVPEQIHRFKTQEIPSSEEGDAGASDPDAG